MYSSQKVLRKPTWGAFSELIALTKRSQNTALRQKRSIISRSSERAGYDPRLTFRAQGATARRKLKLGN